MKLSRADTIALGVSLAALNEADCDPRTSASGSTGTAGFWVFVASEEALLLLAVPLVLLLLLLPVLRGACREVTWSLWELLLVLVVVVMSLPLLVLLWLYLSLAEG